MKLFCVILLWSFALPGALAQSPRPAADPDHFSNLNDDGMILEGYDPVAFFTDSMPVKGDPRFQSTYKGAVYQFSSAGNKAAFDGDPERYKVWFGGWCAWAVSNGYTAPVDINAWSIVEGRLLLQYSPSILKRWNKNPQKNLEKALTYWPYVAANKGKPIDKDAVD